MEKTVHFIMYHYVRDLKNSEYPTIKGLDKELFEKQLAYLLEHYTCLLYTSIPDMENRRN